MKTHEELWLERGKTDLPAEPVVQPECDNPHDPKDWGQFECICPQLAAAEERGRRRGVEERDELRAALRTYRRHHPCDYCETKHVPDVVEKALADLLAEARSLVFMQAVRNPIQHNRDLLNRVDAALAPRDSGKDP